jgi:VWFA-related protein
LSVLCGIALTLPAQQNQPTFRATTRLVEFTVVALDKRGEPVTDLKIDDFTVTEKSKPRAIAFFRFEGPTATEPENEAPELPPRMFSNRIETTRGPVRNLTAIVLDALNTPPEQQIWVRAQTLRYLRAVEPGTRMALYHLGTRLTAIHDFTDDADSLRARLDKLRTQLAPQELENVDSAANDAERLLELFDNVPGLEETLKRQIEMEMVYNDPVRRRRVEATLAHLEALGRHLAGIPGRKNVVWISGGIPIISIAGAMGMGPKASIRTFDDPIRRTSQRLAQQGVALYLADAAGLTTLPGT